VKLPRASLKIPNKKEGQFSPLNQPKKENRNVRDKTWQKWGQRREIRRTSGCKGGKYEKRIFSRIGGYLKKKMTARR
jgi:hypothetical protein